MTTKITRAVSVFQAFAPCWDTPPPHHGAVRRRGFGRKLPLAFVQHLIKLSVGLHLSLHSAAVMSAQTQSYFRNSPASGGGYACLCRRTRRALIQPAIMQKIICRCHFQTRRGKYPKPSACAASAPPRPHALRAPMICTALSRIAAGCAHPRRRSSSPPRHASP